MKSFVRLKFQLSLKSENTCAHKGKMHIQRARTVFQRGTLFFQQNSSRAVSLIDPKKEDSKWFFASHIKQ